MSYTSRFPTALDVRPLPYPLLQSPMVLAPSHTGYGIWTDREWENDDLYGLLPVPRVRFVLASAVLGAGVLALMGKSDAKSLTLGAAGGVLAMIAVSGLADRD